MNLRCWLLHRKQWITIASGLLPWKLDGIHLCPRCDRIRGQRSSVPQRAIQIPAGA